MARRRCHPSSLLQIEDPEFSLTQLCLTCTRAELGKVIVDELFKERDNLSSAILESLNSSCGNWGINCIRYQVPSRSSGIRAKKSVMVS